LLLFLVYVNISILATYLLMNSHVYNIQVTSHNMEQ